MQKGGGGTQKNKGKRKKAYRREVRMSFLSYNVLRGTCLRFPEQLEVVVAGDVLQQRLPARSVALTVLLGGGGRGGWGVGWGVRLSKYERVRIRRCVKE